MNWENSQDLFDQLSAPFPVEEVAWRVGPTNERHRKENEALRGQPLCYIDARSVMDRLDSVCGPENWQCSYTPGVGTSIVCNIGIKITEWIWKGDGAGATDMEAEKGTLSDAFKRAGVRWGIGRYLYEVKSPWMVLDKRGTTAFINDAQLETLGKLYEEHARKIQPAVGVNAFRQAYRLLIHTINGLNGQAASDYGKANQHLIDELPGQMRDHVSGVLQRRIGASHEHGGTGARERDQP
jgi:hypothetical protein